MLLKHFLFIPRNYTNFKHRKLVDFICIVFMEVETDDNLKVDNATAIRRLYMYVHCRKWRNGSDLTYLRTYDGYLAETFLLLYVILFNILR